jgi:hypothetical protein
MKIRKITFWVVASLLLLMNAQADELLSSGFMSDYSQLEKVSDGTADYRFLPPGSEDKMAKFNAVMIDQPEIFIANDSPYRGAKPKHLEALSESLRSSLAASLSEDLYVIDRAGENVLYVSLAISNLKLKKKKKSILGYTPIGLVGGAVANVANSDLAKKAKLEGMVLELEAFDSVSGERIVALIDHLGGVDGEVVPWEELDAFMARYGKIMQCRFSNAKLPAEQRADCLKAG